MKEHPRKCKYTFMLNSDEVEAITQEMGFGELLAVIYIYIFKNISMATCATM
jgi:hypothetical protein